MSTHKYRRRKNDTLGNSEECWQLLKKERNVLTEGKNASMIFLRCKSIHIVTGHKRATHIFTLRGHMGKGEKGDFHERQGSLCSGN